MAVKKGKKKTPKKKTAKKKVAKRTTKNAQSPYQQLMAAGLVSPGVLNADDRNTVNKMSNAEIQLLIKLAGKLGKAKSAKARPNFPL